MLQEFKKMVTRDWINGNNNFNDPNEGGIRKKEYLFPMKFFSNEKEYLVACRVNGYFINFIFY